MYVPVLKACRGAHGSIPSTWVAALAVVLIVADAARAEAGILSVSARGAIIPPPASVASGALEDPDTIFVFQERSNFVLPSDVSVDMSMPGTVNFAGMFATPGVVLAGTRVDSIFVHYDTPQIMLGMRAVQVFMDRPILGVILSDQLLDDSDAILGAPGTGYPGGLMFRGTTGPVGAPMEGFDSVGYAPGSPVPGSVALLGVRMEVEHVLDGVRVLTVPTVPEPPASALSLVGAVMIGSVYALRGGRHRRAASTTASRPHVAASGTAARASADSLAPEPLPGAGSPKWARHWL